MARTAALIVAITIAAVAGGAVGYALQTNTVQYNISNTPEEIVITFLPMTSPDKLKPAADAIAEHISDRIGMPVRASIPTDYSIVVEALRADRAHVAFVGSVAAVLANKEAGSWIVLAEVTDGRPYYKSQYFVRADSNMNSLADLRGKTVAYTSPTSGSGYLFPWTMLIENGLLEKNRLPNEYFREVLFAGGDEFVLKALVRGDVDAAATADYSFTRYLTEEERQKIRVVAETVVPPHGVAISGKLPHWLAADIQMALLELNEPDKNHLLHNLYGAEALVPATMKTYEPVMNAFELTGFDTGRIMR